jgi:chromosome transmission fidelity protein 4
MNGKIALLRCVMLFHTAGEGWIAVATSSYLRLLTAGGIQQEILSLAGPTVTLVGAADKLFVVIHAGHPLPGQQNLAYYTLQISPRSGVRIKSGPLPLPLSHKSELYWAGISDLGLPATVDTTGVVRLLVQPAAAAAWYPICDTRAQLKGKTETFYVISVDQADGAVVGVICKTGKYPPTVPR